MRNIFKNIIVWQKAHELVLKIYKYTKDFPIEEKYSLVDNMRRAAMSIPNNFVEGYRRKGLKDSLNFFNRSDASLAELEYQTLISFDLGFLNEEKYKDLEKIEEEVGRLLNGWQKSYHPTK
jgi:four helix bundle protein